MSLPTATITDRPPIVLPLIVACALFMENLDSTVVATSLPAMARSLGESPLTLNVAMTCYLMSLAIFIPASGWLADRFGARDVFVAAIGVFTLSSLACGIAQNLPEMITARILQGVGGAMMTPVGRLVLLRTVPKHQLVQALSYVTMPALVGPAIGPLIGGFITTYSSWRWIFYINLPIGILGIALAMRLIPNERQPNLAPADIRGLLLSGVGLGFMALGLENVGRGALPGSIELAVIAVAVIAFVFFARHARRHPAPAIDLTLIDLPTFRASVLGGSLYRISIGCIPFLLPLMFQVSFGLTPFESGSLTFAAALGALFMKAVAPPIVRRFGFRRLLVWNAVVCAAMLAVYGLFRPSWPHLLIVAFLLTTGFFRSLQFTCINAIGYSDIPQARMSRATSLSSAAQQLSLSVGVALGAALLAILNPHHATLGLKPENFTPVFAVMAALSLLSIYFFRQLAQNAGQEVSRYQSQSEGK